MKILCIGDSITDMERNKGVELLPYNYGVGYPFYLQGKLAVDHPAEYTVINRGVSGNRITDLYARLKSDCWNLCPDVICCLVGIFIIRTPFSLTKQACGSSDNSP